MKVMRPKLKYYFKMGGRPNRCFSIYKNKMALINVPPSSRPVQLSAVNWICGIWFYLLCVCVCVSGVRIVISMMCYLLLCRAYKFKCRNVGASACIRVTRKTCICLHHFAWLPDPFIENAIAWKWKRAKDTEKTHMSMIPLCNNRVEIYAHKIYTKQLVLGVCCIMCTEWLKLKQLTISCIMYVRIQLCTEAKTSKTKPFWTVPCMLNVYSPCMLVCICNFNRMHCRKVERSFRISRFWNKQNFKRSTLDANLFGLL